MDGQRFDTLARAVTTATSRRAALRALTGTVLAGGALASLGGRTEAGKKSCGGKKDRCDFTSDCCKGLRCKGSGRCKYKQSCGGKDGDYCDKNKDCCDGYRCRKSKCKECQTRNEKCDRGNDCCPGFNCRNGRCEG